jgi:hypothetical protein
MKVHAAPEGLAVDVDVSLRASRGPHAYARLRSDARGRDGGVREELAAGVTPQINRAVQKMQPRND